MAVIYARVSSIGDRQSTGRQVKDYAIRDIAKLTGKGISTLSVSIN